MTIWIYSLGNMVTGWLATADNQYFFFDNTEASMGKQVSNTWKMINGSWYYFQLDGKLLMNGITPDMKQVGADGKLIDITGTQAAELNAKYNTMALGAAVGK